MLRNNQTLLAMTAAKSAANKGVAHRHADRAGVAAGQRLEKRLNGANSFDS